jgi:hypothetical protein
MHIDLDVKNEINVNFHWFGSSEKNVCNILDNFLSLFGY